MWAGPNAPMMQPQHGQSWAPAERVRPHAAWYLLPIVLILGSVLGFTALLVGQWEETQYASGPKVAGDPVNGLTVELHQGHPYFVYVRGNAAGPTTCSIAPANGGTADPVALTKKNSWSATDYPSYRYVATFEAPLSGMAKVTCRGATGELLVAPDDTVDGYLGFALLAGLFLGGLGVISAIVIPLRRRNSKRRIRAQRPPTPGPPMPGGAYPQMPPPGPYAG
ncbi:hypothetical protein ACGFNU_13405 [Spirillospora sp. NPDC048911]|uniref:hypothetical protein n=1 Tax=Spirillospora sp. NPDC048911 TaxID=3364527 RepID=UPI00371AB9FF